MFAVMQALHEAEEAVPGLDRQYCCWQLCDGSVQHTEHA